MVSTGSLLSVEVFTASIIPQRLWFVVTVTGGLCTGTSESPSSLKFQRLGPRTLSESRPHAGRDDEQPHRYYWHCRTSGAAGRDIMISTTAHYYNAWYQQMMVTGNYDQSRSLRVHIR